MALLCLEREIRLCWCSSSDRDVLGLRSVFFLPGCHRVAARRDILDGVVAARVCNGVRTFDDDMPTVHPRMNVALYADCLGSLPVGDNGRSTWRLRLIPTDVAASRGRQRVNVMGGLVIGCDFEFLVGVHDKDVRRIHAALLVKFGLL